MKKHAAALVIALLLAAVMTVPAMADIIWEPQGDSFFLTHRDECAYVDDTYEAQSDAEIVTSPEDPSVVAELPAGTTVYVGYIWSDGTTWGYAEFRRSGGWIRLDGFRRLYDASDFGEEHAAEFTDSEVELTVTPDEVIMLWTFPGSGVAAGSIGGEEYWEEETVRCSPVWTDGDGNAWAEIPYFYGMSGWVYLADPAADDLPATAPHYVETKPEPEAEPEEETVPEAAETERETSAQQTDKAAARTLVPIVVIVVAIAAVTAILIAGFGKKGKRVQR